MSAPLLLILLSTLTVVLSLAFRNDPRTSSILAAVGAFMGAIFIFFVPIDEASNLLGLAYKLEPAWQLLGRALELDASTQPMVGFLYLSSGFLLLPSWLSGGSRYFPPLAVSTLIVAAAALMASPFLYAAIFIEFAAIGGGLMLVSRRTPQNLGALRLLILYTIAMLIILVAGWLIDQGSITSAATEIASRTTLVLIFGIAVLILMPPFHIWLVNASQDTNPYALSYVVVTLQSSALFFLLRFLDEYPWLRDSTVASQALDVGGALCLVIGVLFALSQRDLRKVLAYMIVADIGFAILSIGTFTSSGYRLALGMTASRIVSLGVFSLGLSILYKGKIPSAQEYEPYEIDGLTGLVIFSGMLSLAGFPLTAGFPGRWSQLTVLLDANSASAYIAFVAYLGLCVMALWWGYKVLLTDVAWSFEPYRIEQAFLTFGLLIILSLGVFPQLTYPWVVELVSGLGRLFG